jgi:thiol-disulfide isomerase/thioredoxin
MVGGCDRQSGDAAQPSGAASTAAAPQGAGQGRTFDVSHKGAPLPDLTVTDPSGKTLKLASLKGKPVLINLWATWCGPCVAELPTLGKLAVERVGELQVLLVSQDSDPAKVAPFLREHGVPQFDPWIDPKSDLLFHYESQTLPTTVLYDKDGAEVWRYVGAHDWAGAETAEMLQDALGK